jgi:hypothetical protein
MSNIRDELWEEGVTTLLEYELRRAFYGYLDGTSGDNVITDTGTEQLFISPDNHYTAESYGDPDMGIDGIGWKNSYDDDLLKYLEKGLDSFKI